MADRISKLPDDVLCHILSFLPTEEAAATLVLSKRWRPLWPLVPTLDFCRNRYLQVKKKKKSDSSFVNFVYAAILSRGLHQPIKNFSLDCDDCRDSDVKVWLNAAIQCQVENLLIHLSYPIESFSKVPCSILSCTTLVDLKLGFVYFDAFSSVYLPSLKTLHLGDVWFDKPQFLMELLYGCPILENLIGNDIGFFNYSFDGKVKSLSKLVKADVHFDQSFFIPVKAFSTVEFLRIDQCDVDIPVFPNLTRMELTFGGTVKLSVALDLLNHSPKLQTAVFELTYADDDVWPDPSFVPECFSSHLKECFLNIFSGFESQLRFAKYVLQNSASLRTLTIENWCDTDQGKTEMIITELTSCPRRSANCELLFE